MSEMLFYKLVYITGSKVSMRTLTCVSSSGCESGHIEYIVRFGKVAR